MALSRRNVVVVGIVVVVSSRLFWFVDVVVHKQCRRGRIVHIRVRHRPVAFCCRRLCRRLCFVGASSPVRLGLFLRLCLSGAIALLSLARSSFRCGCWCVRVHASVSVIVGLLVRFC